MKAASGFLTPPKLSDRVAWNDHCEDGRIQAIAGSEVLAAYDHWRGDPDLAKGLRKELARKITVQLRFKISRNLPNKGFDIIDDAVAVVTRALENPTGKRGISFRKNFFHFVRLRGVDALERAGVIPHRKGDEEAREGAVAAHLEYDEDGPYQAASPEDALLEQLDLRKAWERLDASGRMAANMYFYNGDSLDDIAKVLGTTRHQVTMMLAPLRAARRGRGA